MKLFKISILGNGSAVPTAFQSPSSQLIQYSNLHFLVDCGEGTQMQMIRYKKSARRLSRIFISHLHGDHYFGLVGLISTLQLFGRENPLHVYGPEPLESLIIPQLNASEMRLSFELIFHMLPKAGLIYEDKNLQVENFPLNHRISTSGFVFREKPSPRRLSKAFVEAYQPGIADMQQIKQGANYMNDEVVVLKNDDITLPPPHARSYAYCSDTAYDESILPFIKEVDILFHEATFDESMSAIAAKKFHSTAREAATIASKAGVKKLLLGHFSARYEKPDHLLEEAQAVFKHTALSREGASYEL